MGRYATLVMLVSGILLGCASVALAQQDDVDQLFGVWPMFIGIIESIIWSAIYLAIYAACLVVPMSYLQRFTGFDALLLLAIGVLWAGGMTASAIGYGIAGVGRPWLAIPLIMPLIFGWCVLICTRSWVDLSLREALVVAAVTTLLCTPYFGPTWKVKQPPKAPEIMPEESRMTPSASAARLVALPAYPWHMLGRISE